LWGVFGSSESEGVRDFGTNDRHINAYERYLVYYSYMKENPEFIGRPYNKKEKVDIETSLLEWSKESSKPIKGELEKNKEDIEILETIQDLIKDELHSLGINDHQPLSLDKIHILPEEIYKKGYSNSKNIARFISTKDSVYINKDKIETKARMFSIIMHELIHQASKQKFYVDKEKGIYDARVGYRIRSPWKGSNREQRLRGFNELMTDSTVYKILIKNLDSLKKYGISKKDIEESLYHYLHNGPILESIVKKVSVDKDISKAQVFDDFERGQFQESILVLKDIEHSFGKGSLNILSLLEALKNVDDNYNLEEMIKRFFAENNETKRTKINQEIQEFVDKVQNNT